MNSPLRLAITSFGCLCLAAALSLSTQHAAGAEPAASVTKAWSLRDELRDGAGRANPNADRDDEPVWHFLRTTSSAGPVESRKWLRDGKYVPLTDSGAKLFDSPLDGWAYRAAPPLAPLVGKITADYDVGLKFRPGDVLVAPGPDHAVVIGWRSPVAGKLDVRGEFEHAQSCCGVNSHVRWYVERGPAPSVERGFEPQSLAAGEADFGGPTQRGEFVLRDLDVRPDDFLYFVVDAAADGTATPHHGDAVRFAVNLVVRDARPAPAPTFERDVAPLLARACHDCHGGDAREGQLDLRSVSEILRGGESGPAIVRGDPTHSLLVDLVAKGQMPPGDGARLAPREVSLLRRWVRAGAPAEERITSLPPRSQVTAADREYWAFQPPRRGALPAVARTDLLRTPPDAFLLGKLEALGLSFSPEADRAALGRRLAFDLTGLPPEPEAVREFAGDERPDAAERLVDRLLASPRYGERWGRHWLDAAGYVDGKLDNDLGTIYPHSGGWRYRDYVIRAFNADLPFDQFLTEQLAGDELVDWRQAATFDERTLSLLSATGFLRNVDDHTDFPQYGLEKRYEVLNETLDMFSTAVLGLTMECCRCHNHKYDPLPQRDYYRLMACFEPAFNVHAWKPPKERFLADVSPAERAAIDARNAELDRQIAESSRGDAALRDTVRRRVLEARRATIPETIRADVLAAIELAAERRDAVQRSLVEKFQATLKVDEPAVDAALTEAERAMLQANAAARMRWAGEKKSYGPIQALWDVGPPPTTHVHRRGNPKAPGVLVAPGVPEILTPATNLSAAVTANAETANSDMARRVERFDASEASGATSGRRLALARWLVRPDHPLVARVFVNRAWRHHFGRGIVETLGNFGRSGSGPTHPELLDWLAVDFVEHGWNVKGLHRQLVTSTAYRQSSRRPPGDETVAASAPERIDPDNRLLWRANLQRLDAEIVRDALLAVSGSLDRAAGGPPVEITNPPDGLSEPKGNPQAAGPHRRSVYLFARRVYPLKFLEIFDAPIMPVNCTQRTASNTVLQSLALLNSEFLFAQAERLAARSADAAAPDDATTIGRAFELALSRPPTPDEAARSRAFLDEQRRGYEAAGESPERASSAARADFCQMLLASNEFLYVE